MIKKDSSINDLIEAVQELLDKNMLEIIDYWDADLYAIGFTNRSHTNRLIYVSTFNKKPDFYDYECEIINEELQGDTEVVDTGSNINKTTLIEKIKEFLLLGDR